MSQDLTLFHQFAPKIRSLPDRGQLDYRDLLVTDFRLFEDGDFAIYYAPFDYVNKEARIVMIGITPGWTQMEVAYRVSRQGLLNGTPPLEVCRQVKQQASFAGSMRQNLVRMLDQLELPKALGIETSALLFTGYQPLLHTTSAIRYPVFVKGGNYKGSNPKMLKSQYLKRYIEGFKEELNDNPEAIIIPFGIGSKSWMTRNGISTKSSPNRHCHVPQRTLSRALAVLLLQHPTSL